MGWKASLIRPLAKLEWRRIGKMKENALEDQRSTFQRLISTAADTAFGKAHGFQNIKNPEDFRKRITVTDYEGRKQWFERIASGEADVCWPGKPKYLSKTSGTTSGVKYIPITRDSIGGHIKSARNALLNYAVETGNYSFFDGKLIFLSGSPELHDTNGIPTGRLSGISNHEVPFWLKPSQVPSYRTNCIDDWEQKVKAIVKETVEKDMRLISGIPPWVQMYYETLLDYTGKEHVLDVFPNYSVFVYGGVNFEPYRQTLERLVGGRIDSVELYPASEGFIAFQDAFPSEGMLLNTDLGMYYEFIPLSEFSSEDAPRLGLHQVEKGVDYVLVISSNAGLWAYNIGDTVSFTSLDPYRIIVSGRVKHFISAFGEHVIAKEVERAMIQATQKHGADVVEFTVAPQVSPQEGKLPYHEWLVEFSEMPGDMVAFSNDLDREMCEQNIYYKDLIEGKILRPLKVTSLPQGAFRRYMESQGKLGGQNKVPRLSNDRVMAEKIMKL